MDVSIIVITRNRPEMVKKCLDHLEALEVEEGDFVEVVVVDS